MNHHPETDAKLEEANRIWKETNDPDKAFELFRDHARLMEMQRDTARKAERVAKRQHEETSRALHAMTDLTELQRQAIESQKAKIQALTQ